MRNIVVAVDGSEPSALALGWARELARTAPDAVFHLVHAYLAPLPVHEFQAYNYNAVLAEAADNGKALLQRTAAGLEGLNLKLHLRHSAPADLVIDVASEVNADLICMGRQGLGRMAGVFLGSVSAAVMHKSACPVLVVHDSPPRSINKVLVGIDGSSHSARALAWAAGTLPGAQITALHIVQVPPEGASLLEAVNLSLDGAVERTIDDVVTRTLEKANLPAERIIPVGKVGNPAETLVLEYRSGPYDLAVVGSRGLGTLGELLLGSTSERLLRLGNGPVVVVRNAAE